MNSLFVAGGRWLEKSDFTIETLKKNACYLAVPCMSSTIELILLDFSYVFFKQICYYSSAQIIFIYSLWVIQYYEDNILNQMRFNVQFFYRRLGG